MPIHKDVFKGISTKQKYDIINEMTRIFNMFLEKLRISTSVKLTFISKESENYEPISKELDLLHIIRHYISYLRKLNVETDDLSKDEMYQIKASGVQKNCSDKKFEYYRKKYQGDSYKKKMKIKK